jgi:hypothetical protein
MKQLPPHAYTWRIAWPRSTTAPYSQPLIHMQPPQVQGTATNKAGAACRRRPRVTRTQHTPAATTSLHLNRGYHGSKQCTIPHYCTHTAQVEAEPPLVAYPCGVSVSLAAARPASVQGGSEVNSEAHQTAASPTRGGCCCKQANDALKLLLNQFLSGHSGSIDTPCSICRNFNSPSFFEEIMNP